MPETMISKKKSNWRIAGGMFAVILITMVLSIVAIPKLKVQLVEEANEKLKTVTVEDLLDIENQNVIDYRDNWISLESLEKDYVKKETLTACQGEKRSLQHQVLDLTPPQWKAIPDSLGDATNLDKILKNLNPDEFGYYLLLCQRTEDQILTGRINEVNDSIYRYRYAGDDHIQYSTEEDRYYYHVEDSNESVSPINVALPPNDGKTYALTLKVAH